jgi:hypothetical protein
VSRDYVWATFELMKSQVFGDWPKRPKAALCSRRRTRWHSSRPTMPPQTMYNQVLGGTDARMRQYGLPGAWQRLSGQDWQVKLRLLCHPGGSPCSLRAACRSTLFRWQRSISGSPAAVAAVGEWVRAMERVRRLSGGVWARRK